MSESVCVWAPSRRADWKRYAGLNLPEGWCLRRPWPRHGPHHTTPHPGLMWSDRQGSWPIAYGWDGWMVGWGSKGIVSVIDKICQNPWYRNKSRDLRLSHCRNAVDPFLGVQRVFNPCLHFTTSSPLIGYQRCGFSGSFYDRIVKFTEVMTFNHALREIWLWANGLVSVNTCACTNTMTSDKLIPVQTGNDREDWVHAKYNLPCVWRRHKDLNNTPAHRTKPIVGL